MSRKFFVINFVISLIVWGITAVFAINDDIYGWSDRLAAIMFIQSLIYALAYNVKGLNFWKTESKKSKLFYFCLFNLFYTLILILFCREHLSAYVSEDLLRIIMLSIASIGAAVAWIYAIRIKRDIEKEQQKEV